MGKLRGKVWTRRIAGIVARCVDGRTWTWSVGLIRYRWCKLGHLEIVGSRACARINFWRKLDAAIAWTIGFGEGLHRHRSGYMPGQEVF